MSRAAVYVTLRRLEKKGYLARLPRSGDRRVVKIALTTSGDKLLQGIPPLLHEQLSARLNQLDRQELEAVLRGLDTLVYLLDIESVEASPMLTIEGELEENER